jgi:hypothetical protein
MQSIRLTGLRQGHESHLQPAAGRDGGAGRIPRPSAYSLIAAASLNAGSGQQETSLCMRGKVV